MSFVSSIRGATVASLSPMASTAAPTFKGLVTLFVAGGQHRHLRREALRVVGEEAHLNPPGSIAEAVLATASKMDS